MIFKTESFHYKDINELHDFIIETIKTCYFKYYPHEAIDYFIKHSNKQGILLDAIYNDIIVVKADDKIIGTGTLTGAHIKRVFVNPDYQGKGLGRLIMNDLEYKAKNNNLKLVNLHASLSAISFYDRLNYKMFKIGKIKVENGEILYYQRMSKRLSPYKYTDTYNFQNKKFKVVKNDGIDAEVNQDTIFHFLQCEELIFAEYKGGKVKNGEIFGVIEDQSIQFYYHQENKTGQRNQGSSIDQITVLENSKLQLVDKWEWKSKQGNGLCILEEI